MKILFSIFLAIGFILIANYLIAQTTGNQKPTLLYEDYIYDASVKTPLVFPAGSERSDVQSPVISLQSNINLQLEFDWLGETQPQFRAKIINCNADWQPSVLNDVEFLTDFNDFPIYDVELARGTKVGYGHYWLKLPMVKLAGNYIVMIYRGRRESDVVLTRRFMVYDSKVSITAQVSAAQDVPRRTTHQQVECNVAYGSYPVLNPREDLKIVIR
ncbi:MAG: DUF5103 domain-containing protein, partial [Siphonobacter sp.]